MKLAKKEFTEIDKDIVITTTSILLDTTEFMSFKEDRLVMQPYKQFHFLLD